MSWTEILGVILAFLGVLFCLIAAIGVVKFPDLYYRMHAATKAAAFGVSLLLIGGWLIVPTLRFGIEAVLIIVFIYLTLPLAAQMIGRAGLGEDLDLCKETDESTLPVGPGGKEAHIPEDNRE